MTGCGTLGRSLLEAAAAASLCLLAACGPSASSPQATTYTLRYGTPYASTNSFSRADIEWIKHVEAASGGRLRIQPFWAGSLISSEHSLEELRHGVADIGLVTPMYIRGGVHLLKAQSAFYGGVRDMKEQLAVYECLAHEVKNFEQEFAGVRILAVQGGNSAGALTRNRPIRQLADMRGMRLRITGDLVPVMRRLGVDAVTMPASEVYSAMAKGMIDGVMTPPDALKTMHFGEVGRFYTEFDVSRGAYPARAISEQAFARLPADLQQLLLDSKSVWNHALLQILATDLNAGRKAGHEMGVEFSVVAPGDKARMQTIYDEEALLSARHLSSYGIDGELVFHRAQEYVRRIRAGQPACNSGSGVVQ